MRGKLQPTPVLAPIVPKICSPPAVPRFSHSQRFTPARARGGYFALKNGGVFAAPLPPQQNAYLERYNRTVRHEWLDQYIIESIEEAQDFATQWLWTYNNDRPNMGIDGITPAQKLKMAA